MYERDEVKSLLEAMWNGWVLDMPYAPDTDMPRATPDYSKSNSVWAWKIDIERAIEVLDEDQRTLLREHLGEGTSAKAIAFVLNEPTGEIEAIIEGAISDLLDSLNGTRRELYAA